MAIKAKQAKNKPNTPEPEKVNVLVRPQLTKEEKERLEAQFEIIRPQIARVNELINSPFIEYQANLNRILKELTAPALMPSLIIAEQMSGINNIFKDALRVHEMQRELIEQSLAPMREFQDSIKQATRLYQDMFAGFSSPLNILSGLVLNVTLSDHVEKLSRQARTVYDYDEVNSTFNFETNELSTSAKVSTEVETKTIVYKHTRNVNFKLGIFEHDLASFGLKLERIEVNQEVMIANQEKIISYLMDCQVSIFS